MLRGLGECFVGPTFHVNRDKQLNFVQHLICQRTQQKVRKFYLTIDRAQSCLEHSFPDSPRTSRKDGHDFRSRSPVQETLNPSFTIVRRKVSSHKSGQHSSTRRKTYREPSKKDTPNPAVDEAPSGRFRGSLIGTSGGRPDIQPADLPERISVPDRYGRDPDWLGVLELTKNQGQEEVQVFNKPSPRRRR